jgi:hypothetical protein
MTSIQSFFLSSLFHDVRKRDEMWKGRDRGSHFVIRNVKKEKEGSEAGQGRGLTPDMCMHICVCMFILKFIRVVFFFLVFYSFP